jgi:hypothetical protein
VVERLEAAGTVVLTLLTSTENLRPSLAELEVKDTSSSRNLIRLLIEDSCTLLDNVQGCELCHLILLKGMLNWHSVQGTRRDETPIVLTDFNLIALAHELAAARSVGKSRH